MQENVHGWKMVHLTFNDEQKRSIKNVKASFVGKKYNQFEETFAEYSPRHMLEGKSRGLFSDRCSLKVAHVTLKDGLYAEDTFHSTFTV